MFARRVEQFGRGLRRIETAAAWIAIVILILVIGSVCLEVVMRYFFRSPQIWVVELSEYALLYITFLGAAWLLGRDGHVRVDILIGRVPAPVRHRMELFGALVGLTVSIVLTVFGALVTWSHYARGLYKPTILEFPTWIVLAVIPLGAALLALRFLHRALVHGLALRGAAVRDTP